MERISIVDTVSGIVLYDKIYGQWTPEQCRPCHAATLISFFTSFARNLNAGVIQRVVFQQTVDAQSNSKSVNGASRQTAANTNGVHIASPNKLTDSQPQQRSIELLTLTDDIHHLVICIFVNPKQYKPRPAAQALNLLRDRFSAQYFSQLVDIRPQLEKYHLERTDETLMNEVFVPKFNDFDNTIKTLGILYSGSNKLTNNNNARNEVLSNAANPAIAKSTEQLHTISTTKRSSAPLTTAVPPIKAHPSTDNLSQPESLLLQRSFRPSIAESGNHRHSIEISTHHSSTQQKQHPADPTQLTSSQPVLTSAAGYQYVQTLPGNGLDHADIDLDLQADYDEEAVGKMQRARSGTHNSGMGPNDRRSNKLSLTNSTNHDSVERSRTSIAADNRVTSRKQPTNSHYDGEDEFY